MHDERDFLRKLLENPADDTTRLVYADWLDEQGDPASVQKAEFLRLTVRMLDPERDDSEDAALQTLAASLHADWLAIVSRLKVESCPEARRKQANESLEKHGLQFNVVCDRRWDELAVSENDGVRFCDQCKQEVHYCDTIETARKHAWSGECVAVDLGVIRHEGDLELRGMMVGGIGII